MAGFERVEFRSEGYKLIGDLHCPGEKAPCVLLCHGIVSSKDSEKWLTFACRLEDEGFAALRFNFRGCGWGDEWSEGDFQDTTLTTRMKDYKAALDFLMSTGKVNASRLGVLGSSFGGCTILAASDPRPRTYVALATPCKFGATPVMLNGFQEKGYYENPEVEEPRMSRIKETLYHDLVSDARRLYENANEPKRLEIIEGGSHRFVDSGHLGKVVDLSIGWFKEYL